MSLPKPRLFVTPGDALSDTKGLLGIKPATSPTATPAPPTINQATQAVDSQMDMLSRRGAAASLYAGPNAQALAASNVGTKTLLGS